MSNSGQINEAYRKGNRAILVHARQNGQVYFHKQRIGDDFVSFAQFERMDEADFDAGIAASCGEPYLIEDLQRDTPEAEMLAPLLFLEAS